jgi:SAM-dependent methyltransferase
MQEFRYSDAAMEPVACNICGNGESAVVALRDRNGLKVRSVICTNCGLVYLSPRMTAEWYGRYYDAEYRRQTAAYRGRLPVHDDMQARFDKQLRRGRWLAGYLRTHGVSSLRSILDIGGSTGGLLCALRDEFGAEVLGVEPSPTEAAFAEAHGVPTQVGLFETTPGLGKRFDLVICSQTFNHLLDPRGVSEKVRDCLDPGGCFFVECQDFFHVCRIRDAVYEATQIDHAYMFVPETLQSLLEVAGFEIVPKSFVCDRLLPADALSAQRRCGIPSTHMRLLARPSQCAPFPTSHYEQAARELAAIPSSRAKAWINQKRRVMRRVRGRLGDRLRNVVRAAALRREQQ